MTQSTGTQTDQAPKRPFFPYRVQRATTAEESHTGVTTIMAITGLANYLVQRYVFNPVPYQVSIAMYTLVPALIGWVSSHFTIKKVVV